MTRLSWNALPRRYHRGVDRGVLYFADDEVTVWDGLIQVEQRHENSTNKPLYFEGVIYTFQQETPDFTLGVQAFTFPYMLEDHILALTDGRTLVGTFAENQPFGFTYCSQTNDGYRIHLIFNNVATIDDMLFETVNDSPDLNPFGFTFYTTPVLVPGAKPSSHLIIDSTDANIYAVEAVEKILYGTDESSPRFPTVDELLKVFTIYP
jgi:hypothetical protein